MEKLQQAPENILQLEPALTDMILKSKTEKIRRPPNAFMLFARDHRRLIANQHPDACNKTVSTMLGKVWRSAPEDVKSGYYSKAKMLGELHKRKYPDYVYCPWEARKNKKREAENKKKKIKEERNFCLDLLQQNGELREDRTMKIKDAVNFNEEGCMTANVDPSPGPAYVPNNPEFFGEKSSDMNSDDEEQEFDEHPPRCPYPANIHQYQSEPQNDKNGRGQASSGMWRCCEGGEFGFLEKPMPENEIANPYYPDYLPCTYAPPPTFFNAHGHFSPPPMSPYCFSPPPCSSPGLRSYGLPFRPYWNSPTMNSFCFPSSREQVSENLNPYPTSWHAPDYFGYPFSYASQKPSYEFRPPYKEKPDSCQQEQNEYLSKDSESFPSCSRYVNKENNYSYSCVCNSTVDDEMVLHNELIARTNNKKIEDKRNQNLVYGRETRMHDSTNPLSTGPVYSKEDNLSQRKKMKMSVNNFVSRQKYQPRVAYDNDSKREAMLSDFSNFRAQLRPQESSIYGEFSRSNSNQIKFRVRSEETSNSSGSSESDNGRRNFKNMYIADDPLKRIKVSPSCSFPKSPSWHTPVMKSNLPDSTSQEKCNKS